MRIHSFRDRARERKTTAAAYTVSASEYEAGCARSVVLFLSLILIFIRATLVVLTMYTYVVQFHLVVARIHACVQNRAIHIRFYNFLLALHSQYLNELSHTCTACVHVCVSFSAQRYYIWLALNGMKDIFERFQSHSRTYVKSVFKRTHRVSSITEYIFLI